MNGTLTQIRQTMIVPTAGPPQTQAQPAEWQGWGVKLQVGVEEGAGEAPTTAFDPGALYN